VEPRLRRLLDWGGLPGGDHGGHAEDGGVDPWADEAPALAGLATAAVQGITALRRRPGTRLGLRPVLIPDEDFAKVVLRKLAGEAFEADERRHRAGAEALRQCHQRPRAAIVYFCDFPAAITSSTRLMVPSTRSGSLR
jgi:hypothetical protein